MLLRWVALPLPLRPSLRPLCTLSQSAEALLTNAKERVAAAPAVDNATLLKLYGLHKRATAGVCEEEKPGMLAGMKARYKWDAWHALNAISADEAAQQYAAVVDSLVGPAGDADAVPQGDLLRDVDEDGVLTLTLNRPKRFNALNWDLFQEVPASLRDAAGDGAVRAVVMTGAGPLFSSGNDLGNFALPLEAAAAEEAAVILEAFVNAFIEFPKPMFAAVNGPAVGIAMTVLAHFDAVYALPHAYFQTPFTKLGQSPEACSSVLFPRIMGPAVANQVLMFNKKLTAFEARDAGLVGEVVPDKAALLTTVQGAARAAARLPPGSMAATRRLIRGDTGALKATNRAECDVLRERWVSEECNNALAAFAARSKKSK